LLQYFSETCLQPPVAELGALDFFVCPTHKRSPVSLKSF
jgi:hypothetical protein